MSDPKLPGLGDIFVRTFVKTKAAMDSGGLRSPDVKLAPGDKVTSGAMLIRRKITSALGTAMTTDSALDSAIRLHKMHMEDPTSITPATQHEMMAALLKAKDEAKSGVKE